MLLDTIKSDLTKAMKAGDRSKVSCLRLILTAAKVREVELKGSLDDEACLAILRSQVKQISDSIEQYESGGRPDLAEPEKVALGIVKEYLPQELSAAEIEAVVEGVISDSPGANFGLVMKEAMSKLAGQADGKAVSAIVKQKLG